MRESKSLIMVFNVNTDFIHMYNGYMYVSSISGEMCIDIRRVEEFV